MENVEKKQDKIEILDKLKILQPEDFEEKLNTYKEVLIYVIEEDIYGVYLCKRIYFKEDEFCTEPQITDTILVEFDTVEKISDEFLEITLKGKKYIIKNLFDFKHIIFKAGDKSKSELRSKLNIFKRLIEIKYEIKLGN